MMLRIFFEFFWRNVVCKMVAQIIFVQIRNIASIGFYQPFIRPITHKSQPINALTAWRLADFAFSSVHRTFHLFDVSNRKKRKNQEIAKSSTSNSDGIHVPMPMYLMSLNPKFVMSLTVNEPSRTVPFSSNTSPLILKGD